MFTRIMKSVTALAVGLLAPMQQADAQAVKICATVPELGSLAREVGGENVSVTVFAKGTEDPHFVDARPSSIKALSKADLYLQVGLELEIGWAPVLLKSARNAKVLPGAPGYVDASTAITPLEVPSVTIDRSMGDVHPLGNPHYLLDPVNGVKVARLIRDRLCRIRPDRKEAFSAGFESFRRKLGASLVGDRLAEKYDFEKLAILAEHGKLGAFLKSQGESDLLGGWLGDLSRHRGAKAVADHNLWPYFASRFGLEVVGFLEPLPAVPPTTRHLRKLVTQMKAEKVSIVLAAAYYDPRHARFVSSASGAAVLSLANQVGARPDTGDYVSMANFNVSTLTRALK